MQGSFSLVELKTRKDRQRRPISRFFLYGALLGLGLVLSGMYPGIRDKESRDKISRDKISRDKPSTNQLIDDDIQKNDEAVATSKAREMSQGSRQESAIDTIVEKHLSTNGTKETNHLFGENEKNALNQIPVTPAFGPIDEQKNVAGIPLSSLGRLAAGQSVQSSKAKTKYPWKFVLDLAPGVSYMQLANSDKTGLVIPVSYPNGSSSGTVAFYPVSTNIHLSFSFQAGALVQKYLSQNIYFSTGLNYHYYSTTTTFSSEIPNSGTAIGNFNFSYADSYHFIELPLVMGFHWNLNQMPAWVTELGFTISQLIGANAHAADTYTFSYYTLDNGSFNHTQIFANFGLLFILPVKQNQVSMGPVFQYGMTNMMSKEYYNPEHLLFLGFRFGISLNKK